VRVLPRIAVALVLAALFGNLLPSIVIAADPVFGPPSATGPLGGPLSFNSTIEGTAGGTVEVLVGLATREPRLVIPAVPGPAPNFWLAEADLDVASSMECTCFANGPSTPNTRIAYQFRVRAADGTVTLGPAAEITVVDDRFAWQTLEDGLVRVHWYERDVAFAQSEADVANGAIDRASELLGTTLPVPVDLFIYATQEALLEAVSPGRESIAGEAHSNIATMFVWIPPTQAPADSAVTVAHELTHLVFNEATFNRFHGPPRWLNEGIAVYLSEGYGDSDRALVAVAALNGTLIPLQGIAGLFPSPVDQFYLAYSEAVSAVDFFVRSYSDQTLWDLVRSYAQGLSDDDAFTAATGADVTAFNAAWVASLGAEVRDPVGPQPAPPGPVPSAWNAPGQPTSSPGQPSVPPGSLAPGETATPAPTVQPGRSQAPVETVRPVPTARPIATPRPGSGTSSDQTGPVIVLLAAVVVILIAVLLVVWLIVRRQNRRPPPGFSPTEPPRFM
jgi:hypothetical protein